MAFFRNFDQWAANLRRERLRIREAARAAMPAVGRSVRDMVRDRIPPDAASTAGMTNTFPGYAATGRMKTSFVASPIREEGNRIIARVGLRAGYASIDNIKAQVHEFGATIRPVRAQALRFEIGGVVYFAKQVRIRPKGYFAAAWAQAEQEAPAILHARFIEMYR